MSELLTIPLRLIDESLIDENLIDESLTEESGAEGKVVDRDGHLDIPLIVVFEDRRFRALCNERYLTFLRREKKNAHQAFVFAKNDEYSYYYNNFGKQFQII